MFADRLKNQLLVNFLSNLTHHGFVGITVVKSFQISHQAALLLEIEVKLLIKVTSVLAEVGGVRHVLLHGQALPLVHEDVRRALVNAALWHLLARGIVVAKPLL